MNEITNRIMMAVNDRTIWHTVRQTLVAHMVLSQAFSPLLPIIQDQIN
jgi:hypothetical protein